MSLLNAIRRGDTVRATRLLAQGTNPSARFNGISPIELAIRKGNLTMVRRLVHYGANTNVGAITSALLFMNMNNSNKGEQILDFLLKAGAPIGTYSIPTIVTTSLPENNKVRLIRKLVKKGANVNFHLGGRSALEWAIGYRNLKVVQTLMRLGARMPQGIERSNLATNAAARGLAQRVKARQRRNAVSRLNAEFRQKKALNMLNKTIGKKQFNTHQGRSTLPPNVLRLIAQKSTPVKVKKYPNNNRNRNIFYNARSQFNNNN